MANSDAAAFSIGYDGYGFLYGSGAHQFGIQLLASIAIALWTLILNGALFAFMNSQSCFKCGHDELECISSLGISRHRGSPIVSDIKIHTSD